MLPTLKSQGITLAAKLAIGKHLTPLHKICAEQKSISTAKLAMIIEEIESCLKSDSRVVSQLTKNQ